jgi:hypothetical protein
MDMLQGIGGLSFIIGIPLLCLFLLRRQRVQNKPMPFLGWSLFLIGSLMAFLTVTSYIPALFMLPMLKKFDWFVAFAIWFFPPVLIAWAGWLLKRKRI